MEEDLDTPPSTLPKTPVLITAATFWEAEPLARALGLRQDVASRWGGEYAGRKITLIKTGVGAKNTADQLGQFDPKSFGLCISAGLCGALHPAAKAGDIVADVREAELDLVKRLRETALKLVAPFHFGKILHTNIVLQPKTKKALGEEHRAVACDMESQAVRRWAGGKNAAIAVRVVLDELDEACPTEVPAGEDIGSQIKFAVSHASSLPLLIKTGWRSARAMKSLSRFLAAYLEAL